MKYYVLIENRVVEMADLMQWARWYEAALRSGQTRIAVDTVGKFRISTVFLSLDHNFSRVGPPVLFETMVFESDGSEATMYEMMARYCTLDEARAGHRLTVDSLRISHRKSIEITRITLDVVRRGMRK